ncbi:MAG: alpha/beta fold hydrolase, partial [Solirubrobacterales bacterium]|nr:alpha/beta fold hydrolase [Solirubrobacterales bacterium]
ANPGRTAVVALAGGPGQAAVPLAQAFANDLGPALAFRDLLVYDQRGTGSSGSLACAALQRTSGTLAGVARQCSEQIGPARAFFRTPDSVQDIEALRVAGGYDKLVLYGVSYGTKVATAYASAYPGNVASLVLDSVVTPEGPDAFRRSSLGAVPRVLSELCAGGACKGITSSSRGDVTRLAKRLRRKPLKGSVYSPSGRRFTARLGEGGLFAILLAGDLNPTLRAELPGSLRAALSGDTKPLLRLSVRSAGLENGVGYQSSAADSDALFLATTCEENPTFPWTRGASQRQREREAEAAAAKLSGSSIFPFSRTTALEQGILPLCLGWKTASPPPVADGPLPAVPMLVLDGRSDLRTPFEDASAVAARVPGAQLVGVPNVGHSVLGSDATACSRDAIAAFFAGQPVGQCAPAANRFSPTPRPPTRASRLKPYAKTKGKVGRTVEALRLTVNDAQAQILGEALALGSTPAGAGGLRSGAVRVTSKGLSLRRYEYVPDVVVTGTLRNRGTSSFRLSGRQASGGVLRVTQGLEVSGKLDGRTVSTRFGTTATAASAGPYGGLTLGQAVARGKRIRAAVG